MKAKKYFRHCIKLNPSGVSAHFGLARILHHSTDSIEDALKHYLIVVENDPNHFKALCQIGIIYMEQYHDFDLAAENIKLSLQINPKYIPSIIALGNLLFETGHPLRALNYYDEALQIDPEEL
jgi:tetratricopeptide (TPR) repeat protein